MKTAEFLVTGYGFDNNGATRSRTKLISGEFKAEDKIAVYLPKETIDKWLVELDLEGGLITSAVKIDDGRVLGKF